MVRSLLYECGSIVEPEGIVMNDVLQAVRTISGAAATQERESVFVTFQIAYQHYALPLSVVREVVRLPALVPLAGSPPTLCGLLNLRGQYLPILDGRILMGEQAIRDLTNQILIVGREQPEVGLLVDQVQEIFTLPTSQIRPINRSDIAPFLTSVSDLAGVSILLFDPEALLAMTRTSMNRNMNGLTPHIER